MSNSRKILVTGGAGFIGSHTCVELISNGFIPIIVDDLRNSHQRILDGIKKLTNSDVQLYKIDCSNQRDLNNVFEREKEFDGVIHFAASKSVNESVLDPIKYYENNIGSLISVLKAMSKYGTKNIIFSSSCAVYGQPNKFPVKEDFPDGQSTSPYGYTKIVCEHLVRDMPSLNRIILRYFNPIGAHSSSEIGELPMGDPSNLVPILTQTAAGIRDSITVFGSDYDTYDGSCIRDYIHVVDIARSHIHALKWSLEKESICEIFNVGVGRGYSVLEIISLFERTTGVKINYKIGDRRSGDIQSIYSDSNKFKSMTEWGPIFSIEEALRDSWNWQKKL